MFRIKEALAYAKEKGLIKKNSDLANELWCNSTEKSAYMNFRNLIEGKSKKINIGDVPFICKALGVSADYLFGLSDIRNNKEEKETLITKANEIIEIATKL